MALKNLSELDAKQGPTQETVVQQRFTEALTIITDAEKMAALGAKPSAFDVKAASASTAVNAGIDETNRAHSASGASLSPDDVTKARSSSADSNMSTESAASAPWKPHISPRQGEHNVDASMHRKLIDLSFDAPLPRPYPPSHHITPMQGEPAAMSRASSEQPPRVHVSEPADMSPLSQSAAHIVPRGLRVLPRSQTDGYNRHASQEGPHTLPQPVTVPFARGTKHSEMAFLFGSWYSTLTFFTVGGTLCMRIDHHAAQCESDNRPVRGGHEYHYDLE